ncbi:major histocompatibility complex class I LLA isoform X1 [Danio rerio]|uniref:Major histocompatibility complex class I LLA n=3 Tax=Danio rerio TaxID=7955 RepID=A0A0G2KIH5_DANRE|nr:major histocompatibility complex class I LLA precursor [Danio rerio]|eukprot:NP_001314818.1 major histocompatibility complex class I LLA precursor [Danio rerio]
MTGKVLFVLFLLSAPTTVLTDSHSLWLLGTYIKGETQFPKLSFTVMLDDLRVGFYNSETKEFIPRDNTTNEDEAVSDVLTVIQNTLEPFMMSTLTFKNGTESPQLFQITWHCELLDNDKPGQIIFKIAFSGSTTDEVSFYNDNFTCQCQNNMATVPLESFQMHYETVCYPNCIATIRDYLKKRQTQVNGKVQPKVRLIKKVHPKSGGFRLSCLATEFYPHSINLTLLRDGQPVSDHEVTGGNLLPNGDGTYQMRKSLEIRADEREKHKYTCSVSHLSLDKILDIDFEFDPSFLIKIVIPVVVLLSLMLVLTAVLIHKCKNKRAESKETITTASTPEPTEMSETLRK